MDKLNTHYYDGKLSDAKLSIKSYLDEIVNIPKDEKLKALETFNGGNNLTTIINDYRNGSHANFDPTNQLYAHDLLYILYIIKLKNPKIASDIDRLLEIQLTEMSGGMCPQGRTHRLIQIILAVID